MLLHYHIAQTDCVQIWKSKSRKRHQSKWHSFLVYMLYSYDIKSAQKILYIYIYLWFFISRQIISIDVIIIVTTEILSEGHEINVIHPQWWARLRRKHRPGHKQTKQRCKRRGKTAILQHINTLITGTYYCNNMISRETETANMGFTGDKCIQIIQHPLDANHFRAGTCLQNCNDNSEMYVVQHYCCELSGL